MSSSRFPKIVAGFLLGGLGMVMMSCESTQTSQNRTQASASKPFHSKAYRPQNPSAVRVKVSIANQMIYVMEGDRPLLVTPTCVGAPSTPTPMGNFRITIKTHKRRSYSYGQYPLPYWCEFKSAYGFHGGWVHPYPKTHGCLRLHQNVAPKFFQLIKVGTPVNISRTQPEDQTLGKNVPRPRDYDGLEYPPHILMTDRVFNIYQGPIYED